MLDAAPENSTRPRSRGPAILEAETQSPGRLPRRESRRERRKRRNLGRDRRAVNPKLRKSRRLREPGRGGPPGSTGSPGAPGSLIDRTPGGDWSGKRDSNPRPSAWKADALPLSYSRSSRCTRKVWWRGEDSNLRRLRRQIYSLLPLTAREPLRGDGRCKAGGTAPGIEELAKGLEPPTASLQMRCSTS